MPKVSICIPTYNNVDDVRRLLESIEKQTFTDYEINISDDSTNAEISNYVSEFTMANTSLNLNYIHNEKPLGHIFNWNAAIRMATGEFIKIMFSDDWFTDENSLQGFVDLLEKNPQVDLAFCGSRQVMLGADADKVSHVTNEHAVKSYDRHASDEFIKRVQEDYRNFFLGNEMGCPSALIYRRGEKLVLFDEQSNWASDMFVIFDLLIRNNEFAYTKEPLVSIGVHEHQYTELFSDNDERVYNDYKYMYEKYDLQTSEQCRDYFLEEFIVKYHKSCAEAKKLGITSNRYIQQWTMYKGETIKCFFRARFQKK